MSDSPHTPNEFNLQRRRILMGMGVAGAALAERGQIARIHIKEEMSSTEGFGKPAEAAIGERDPPLVPQARRMLDLNPAHDLEGVPLIAPGLTQTQ